MILTEENRILGEKLVTEPLLPTQTELGSNLILLGERPATNGLSHGTAFWYSMSVTAGGRVPFCWNIT